MKSAFVRPGAVACLLGLGLTAQAQVTGIVSTTIPYTFIDAQYSFARIDVSSALGGGDIDGDGPNLNGSLAISKTMHVVAGFERLSPDDIEVDDGLGNITVIPTDDLDTWMVGFGLNTPPLGRADRQYRGGVIDRYSLFADARYLGQDSGGSDRNGWSVNGGFRSVNFSRVEVLLGVGYEDFEKQDGEFTAQGQLLVRVVGNWQLRGGFNYSDDISRWNLGLRYHFGDWSLFGR